MNPFLKLALDLGPLLIFFAANGIAGIFTATGVFMAAMTASIAISYAIEKKFSPVALVTFALVMIFGGLTLWLSNEIFIKVKPTILYLMFGSVLLGGLFAGRLFIKLMLGQSVALPDGAWRVLTWRWAAFFLALAAMNEYAWRNFETDIWVAFKVWVVFPLTLRFALLQTPYIMRHQIEGDQSSPAP